MACTVARLPATQWRITRSVELIFATGSRFGLDRDLRQCERSPIPPQDHDLIVLQQALANHFAGRGVAEKDGDTQPSGAR
jgi:hypothetical protein